MNYKVFISGATPENSKAAIEAEQLWHAIGVWVINPLPTYAATNEQQRGALKSSISKLLSCAAIYLMDGWELDCTARIHYGIARELAMDIYMAKDGIVNPETYNVINAVVRRDNILRVLRIAQAIRQVMGVTFAQIQNNEHKRMYFMARMIFAHECRQFMMLNEIAMIMFNKLDNGQGARVRYFLRKFIDEHKYNRVFARTYKAIIDKLAKYNDTTKQN